MLHAQVLTRVCLDGRFKSKRVIALRDDQRLPLFVQYCPLKLQENVESGVYRMAVSCKATIPLPKISQPSPTVADEPTERPGPSSRSKSSNRRRRRQARSLHSLLSVRESARVLDDRSAQKKIMSQLAVDNLCQLSVEVFSKSQDTMMANYRTDEILFILVSFVDEHSKVVTQNLGAKQISCRPTLFRLWDTHELQRAWLP